MKLNAFISLLVACFLAWCAGSQGHSTDAAIFIAAGLLIATQPRTNTKDDQP